MQYAAAVAPVTHQLAARIAGRSERASASRMRPRLQTFRHLASWRLLMSSSSSNAPETTTAVYGGAKLSRPPPADQDRQAARPRVTLATLRGKHRRGEAISMVTAYDYLSAVHVDSAGVDMILVGDSAAMVVHGHDNTLPISLDLMLQHCRAVVRGAPRPLVVGDLPFGSYESSTAQVDY